MKKTKSTSQNNIASIKEGNQEKKEENEEEEEMSSKWWCYLLINFKPYEKINTFIDESMYPDIMVNEHNKGKVKGTKSTKSAAGHWELDMIIGPFPNEEDAQKFTKQWKNNSRGIPSRQNRGIELSNEYKGYNIICYNRSNHNTKTLPDRESLHPIKKRKRQQGITRKI